LPQALKVGSKIIQLELKYFAALKASMGESCIVGIELTAEIGKPFKVATNRSP